MSSQQPTLKVNTRKLTGRKVKQLRNQGLLPANIFGKKIPSVAIELKLRDFDVVFKQVGETGLIDLLVDDVKPPRPVLVSNLQVNPITDLPIHVDFHQVDLKEKVTATVPVEVVGEAPAEKEKGGVLFVVVQEFEVEALPTDLPDSLTVDISSLKEIGDSLLVKDLKVDRTKVTIALDDQETVVVVQEPKEEEEPAPAPEVTEEGEAPAEEEAAAEGETPAEPEGGEPTKAEAKSDKTTSEEPKETN